jgi:hypothetical protein
MTEEQKAALESAIATIERLYGKCREAKELRALLAASTSAKMEFKPVGGNEHMIVHGTPEVIDALKERLTHDYRIAASAPNPSDKQEAWAFKSDGQLWVVRSRAVAMRWKEQGFEITPVEPAQSAEQDVPMDPRLNPHGIVASPASGQGGTQAEAPNASYEPVPITDKTLWLCKQCNVWVNGSTARDHNHAPSTPRARENRRMYKRDQFEAYFAKRTACDVAEIVALRRGDGYTLIASYLQTLWEGWKACIDAQGGAPRAQEDEAAYEAYAARPVIDPEDEFHTYKCALHHAFFAGIKHEREKGGAQADEALSLANADWRTLYDMVYGHECTFKSFMATVDDIAGQGGAQTDDCPNCGWDGSLSTLGETQAAGEPVYQVYVSGGWHEVERPDYDAFEGSKQTLYAARKGE